MERLSPFLKFLIGMSVVHLHEVYCLLLGAAQKFPKFVHLTLITYQNFYSPPSPSCINTVILAAFPRSKALLEVILHQHLHHNLQFSMDHLNALKVSPLELQFYFVCFCCHLTKFETEFDANLLFIHINHFNNSVQL
jgi:hypothetical protein